MTTFEIGFAFLLALAALFIVSVLVPTIQAIRRYKRDKLQPVKRMRVTPKVTVVHRKRKRKSEDSKN